MVGNGNNYLPMKMMMKRKEIDLDEVSDDFHDFSLSSPARKIRRLNAQLPPIMEEDREQDSLHVGSLPIIEEDVVSEMASLGDPVNEERAIVLYKPRMPTSPSITVNLDSLNLVSGFKNQILWASQTRNTNEDEEYLHDENNATTDKCLAVVPWVPSQFPVASNSGTDASQMEPLDLMEADNMEEAAMDIEENNNSSIEQGQSNEFGGMREGEGLPQWPQQHCLIPQFPQSTSTPITWFQ
ncbi:hypothetical protein Pint_21413 [Pistacia integerrima]|uniref:Uncharacterized protein n=1 Tax=Pistacia integerrima TaxID=434235 RepID=A0ACC0XAJ1_9ROSI|nr:hypothetical protein Pint_21413 [Pistacia integerrima]